MEKIKQKALTFDDVLLQPSYSDIMPREVDLTSQLTRELRLNIPIISSAMDTVTESRLAITLAQEGGIGIIHKNLSPAKQAIMVDRVKRSESGMILNPVTVNASDTIADAKKFMSEYKISGLPVIKDNKLTGILTNRDIRFELDDTLKVSERMTSNNLITVPTGTSLDKAKLMLQKHRIEKLLVVDPDGNLSGLITVKDIQKKEELLNIHFHSEKYLLQLLYKLKKKLIR